MYIFLPDPEIERTTPAAKFRDIVTCTNEQFKNITHRDLSFFKHLVI